MDLNGKRFAWQGVALLPFVEESRLIRALEDVYPNLTTSESEPAGTTVCVCVSARVCVCLCVCVHACSCVHAYVRAFVHVRKSMYMHMSHLNTVCVGRLSVVLLFQFILPRLCSILSPTLDINR